MKDLDVTILICVSYIHDVTSTYYNDSIFEELETDILRYSGRENPILMTGGFNARTGNLSENYDDSGDLEQNIPIINTFANISSRNNCDLSINSHGEKIIKLCKTYDFKILNGRTKGDIIGNFTHTNNNKGTSTIDYSLCNQYLYQNVENFIILPINEISDHSKIVTFLVSSHNSEFKDQYKWKKLKARFKWDEISGRNFSENILENQVLINEILQRIEAGLIDSTGEMIQRLYFEAALKTFKQRGKNTSNNWKKRKKNNKKWFDSECNTLKHEVRNLGKKKHEIPNDSLMKEKYHKKLNEYKKKCKYKRNNFWKKTFEDIENSLGDPKTFWKKWKNSKECFTHNSQPNISGNKWYDYFTNLHTEKGSIQTDSDSNQIEYFENGENNELFTRIEFDKVIKKLKMDKSEGSDSISNEMVKNSPKLILDILFKFINTCFNKSLAPKSWCLDLINPIHKEGSKDDPNNYRGLCISSALLKILCFLLNKRILSQVRQRNLINKNQTGFKEKHRTADNLLTLKNVVKKYVTIGKGKIYAFFIDFKKTYDSVWHEGLFTKMRKNLLGGKLLDVIRDIYKKTKCAVRIGGNCTQFFSITKGVRQGCPLSPILFNLYVNDIFQIINENNDSNLYLTRDVFINALMYADDLILLSDTAEGLQKQINKLSKYCEKWRLNINLKKSKIMIFNRGNKLIKSEFTINEKVLENVKSMKYLGFKINAKNCSFLETLDELSIKAKRTIYAINNTMKISQIPIKLTLKLFDTLIKPILLYGAEVWGIYTNFDYSTWENSKIEMIQTQFLKRALGCNVQTSNNMTRGEVGARPLLTDVNFKVITYIKNILERDESIVYSSLEFEKNNQVKPNLLQYINNFDLCLDENTLNENRKKNKIKCQDNYDRIWHLKIMESPKAISYCKFKYIVGLEKYLYKVRNIRHRISLTRLRLSNHKLLIETGRHLRPKLERNQRKCFTCKDEIEDELHFIMKCPLYATERQALFTSVQNNCRSFNLLTNEEKFVFIMSNEDENVMANLAKFTYKAMQIRDTVVKI